MGLRPGRCPGRWALGPGPDRPSQPEPHLQDVGGGDVHGFRPSVVQILHHHLQRERPRERHVGPECPRPHPAPRVPLQLPLWTPARPPSADPPNPSQAETQVCVFRGKHPQKSTPGLPLLTPVSQGISRAREGKCLPSRTLRPEGGSWRGLGQSGPVTPTPEPSQGTRYPADHLLLPKF